MDLFRFHPQEQTVETGHHQTLDVVSMTVLQRLPDCLSQAVHLTMTRPIKLR